jgi:hypothetical protein
MCPLLKQEGDMGELNRGERLQIMLTEDELKAVDDWRFKLRMPSRASAVRELLKRGLAAEGFDIASRGAKSKDFGVIAEAPAGRDGGGKSGARAGKPGSRNGAGK